MASRVAPAFSSLPPITMRTAFQASVRGVIITHSRAALSRQYATTFRPSIASTNTTVRQKLNPFSLTTFRQLAASTPAIRSSPLTFHAQLRSASTNSATHNLLAHLEQTANSNPGNSAAQNGFYSALLRANMPEILVERYETGRYATNVACDAMYHRALERMSQAQPGANAVSAGQPGAQAGLTQSTLNAVTRAVSASYTDSNKANIKIGQGGTGAKASPLFVTIDESRKSYVFRVIRFLLVFAVGTYLAIVVLNFGFEWTGLLRRATGGGASAKAKEVKAEDQKTRFSDVKGCDEAIEELREIVDFLKNPDQFNSLGGKPPKGILMVGPPGTGKTLLARAVAGEAGVPFFYMSGSEFDEVFVGVGAKRVRELFSAAKSKAPAIVFIDEIDAVGGKRNERDPSYHKQTLNQMLTELDGFDQKVGVIFIAATNFPQVLDKALLRPGRFDRQVVVGLPDVRGRIDVLKHHTRNMKLAADINISDIARGTHGFSGAELENLVNQAAVKAGKNKAKSIGMKDLDWAKDRIMIGAHKTSMVIRPEEKLMTAYHEAGHALMYHFNDAALPLYKVTILPRGQTLGVTHGLPDIDKYSQSKREYLAQIDVSMGGKVAEELVYGADEVTSGCGSDLLNATRTAYLMVTRCGMGETLGSIAFESQDFENLSSETKRAVEDEVRRILDASMERTRRMLTSKREELELVAQGLMKYETLTAEEMKLILDRKPLPSIEENPGSAPPPGTLVLPEPGIKVPDIVLPPSLMPPTGGVGEALPTPEKSKEKLGETKGLAGGAGDAQSREAE